MIPYSDYICDLGAVMNAEWIDVGHAAAQLGVSERQARRLAASGALPAHRLAGRWLVEARGVHDRQRRRPEPGRPVSSKMAWRVLRAVDAFIGGDRDVDPLAAIDDRRVRHRFRSLVAAAPPAAEWSNWLVRRADPLRVWVHPGVHEHLARDPRIHRSALPRSRAVALGVPLPDEQCLYVAEADLAGLLADHRAEQDGDSDVLLMVVPADAGDVLDNPGARVPDAVGLVDLLESPDARIRYAAAIAMGAAIDRLRLHLADGRSG
jgi:hypothetical protein